MRRFGQGHGEKNDTVSKRSKRRVVLPSN